MGGSVFEHRLLFQSEDTNHNQYKHYGGLANNFEFKLQPFFFYGLSYWILLRGVQNATPLLPWSSGY